MKQALGIIDEEDAGSRQLQWLMHNTVEVGLFQIIEAQSSDVDRIVRHRVAYIERCIFESDGLENSVVLMGAVLEMWSQLSTSTVHSGDFVVAQCWL